MIWSKEKAEEFYEIFRIANNWRDSHAYPMRSLRHEIIARMRVLDVQGITAARLKRMRSIRKKLRTISASLNQIQDLGGCRVILPSISELNRLIEEMNNNQKHLFHNEKNYINTPKLGGYRCHHLVYKFHGQGDGEAYNGRRVEIQIRTRLQHSWATAVEAVGLVRQEDMKAGQGNSDWLRLFDLMSAELAMAENCPESDSVPSHDLRVQEIKDLDKKLDAINALERLRHAVRFTDMIYDRRIKPEYYRIEYNNATNTVNVTEHFRPMSGISDYNKAEEEDNITGGNKINTVFVEADKVEDLKEAYPNYFGDVQLFNKNLKAITQGEDAREYTMPPRYNPPPPPKEPPDLSWFRPGRRRRWK